MRKSFALLLLLTSSAATAFQEDICPAPNGGGWRQCLTNPCPPGDEGPHCGASSSNTALSSTFLVPVTGKGARSTIHFDATYFLAQAVGFSPRDAYVIAAYNAATDMGQYVHRDQQGRLAVDPRTCSGTSPVPACSLLSETVGGVVRNNFADGGLFFHFTASPREETPGEGLAPAVEDPYREPFLNSVRRWTYGAGPLCVGGLLDAQGGGCFVSAVREQSTLVGRMPAESETHPWSSVDWVSAIGEQKIVTDPETGENTPASQLSEYVPPSQLPLARLGIYLHALADRISHYRCVDASGVQGPRDANAGPVTLVPLMDLMYQTALHLGSLPSYLQNLQPTPPQHDPDYMFLFHQEECDQSNHFMRHSWETGHDHRQLAPEDQTARHGLIAVLVELERYAAAYGLPSARSLGTGERVALVDAILDATSTAGAQQRVDALTELAQRQGWLPLPLHGGESLPSWEQKAGAAMFGAPAPRSGSGGQGGGALSATLLLALLVACAVPALQRRDRRADAARQA